MPYLFEIELSQTPMLAECIIVQTHTYFLIRYNTDPFIEYPPLIIA